MNLITAMIIQTRGDDIVCSAGGPSKSDGKYTGLIILYRNGEYDRDLLSSEPVFDSEEAAVAKMKEIVAKVRSIDLIAQSKAA